MICAVPVETPVTKPLDGITVATAGFELNQDPPVSPLLLNKISWLTQTEDGPLEPV